ncbi:MAG: response regulator [Flavobacteriia bacterium]|nr:response regulator [Flavobacteriia bacterium]
MSDQIRILYVEDNAINRLTVEKQLGRYATVDTEATGYAGIQTALARPYDIYLIDLNLGDPAIDGFEVLRVLKHEKGLKGLFVALTAYTGPEWENKCLKAGFDMYQSKPISGPAFWERLSTYES